MVLQEANGEPIAGMVAVAGTVLDRAADPRWPNTSREVVYQPYQYSGMALKIKAYSREAIELARAAVAISRIGVRPCGKVLWYHNYSVNPGWAKRVTEYCTIGGHVFYGD